jgi:hypothetical protein
MKKNKEEKPIYCSTCKTDLTNADEFWFGGNGIECYPCFTKEEPKND